MNRLLFKLWCQDTAKTGIRIWNYLHDRENIQIFFERNNLILDLAYCCKTSLRESDSGNCSGYQR